MAYKLHELNVRLSTDLRDYAKKDDLQVQLKIPYPSFNAMIDHVASAEPSNRPKQLITKKLHIPMNPDMVLIVSEEGV